MKPTIAYVHSSHLDLFWLGNYHTCLARGNEIIKAYIDRCMTHTDETFLLESVVFAEHFLKTYPDYIDIFKQLIAEKRLEIGCAYIDRWETLILAESHIRNVVLGKRWCQDVLDYENAFVTHPDLPSLIPQIAQIYRQAGIQYYATSRKIYQYGQVWRHRSPDGSRLLMLSYPYHYMFVLMSTDDVSKEGQQRIGPGLMDLPLTRQGFPQGVIMVNASAGDLAGRENFRRRYENDLDGFVTRYREEYPDMNFVYRIPSSVLEAYTDQTDIPEHAGEIPSVWGVVPDEEAQFFQRDRQLEASLLTAESMIVLAHELGLDWYPPQAADWQGVFYEPAFFREDHPIARDDLLQELWRMHIFTQDHNGGGQEGALSSFQKRVIQERCQRYCDAIISRTIQALLEETAGHQPGILVFNPHGQPWSGIVELCHDQSLPDGSFVDVEGQPLLTQPLSAPQDNRQAALWLNNVPAFGYQFYPYRSNTPPPASSPHPVQTSRSNTHLRLKNAFFEIEIDLSTGNLTRMLDCPHEQDWGHAQAGALTVIEEGGTDTSPRFSPDAAVEQQQFIDAHIAASGTLFTQVQIHKRIARSDVVQTVTLWHHAARVDLDVNIYWWGMRRRQVRLHLPGRPAKSDIAYGSPFAGSRWDAVNPLAAPRVSDEIQLEVFQNYREIQGWLHLKGTHNGLGITTMHPGFFHQRDQLHAVLLRTAQSCGDNRFYWENAGKQRFHFTFRPAETDWQQSNVMKDAAHDWRVPTAIFSPAATHSGDLPQSASLLDLQSDNVLLSAVYPSVESGAFLARIYNTTDTTQRLTFAGELADRKLECVDFMEEPQNESVQSGTTCVLRPWGIQTLKLT